MQNKIKSILKKCFKKEKLNILTAPVHERFQSNWSTLPHNFFLIHCPNGKTWDAKFAPLPNNHTLIGKEKGLHIPPHIEIDVVISQNKFDNFQTLAPIAKQLHVPLISIEHTAPMPNWPQDQIKFMKDQMRGHVNIFITDWSKDKWGWNKEDGRVIYHGVDTQVFKFLPTITKKSYILTTVNQYSQPVRHWCCGFPIFQEIVKNDLPFKNLGDDPGFSEPAKNIDDLVFHHNEAAIFLNTSTFSPVPMSVMEAMSCGGCVVSLASCEIPNIIKHGENGFLGNSPAELRKLCLDLLEQPELRYKVGQNARRTIEERFGLQKFVKKWNELLWKTYETY